MRWLYQSAKCLNRESVAEHGEPRQPRRASEWFQTTPLAGGKSSTTGGLSTNINTQEAKELKVVIQLKDISDEIRNSLRPGMSATAVITTKTVENVITIPLQALI